MGKNPPRQMSRRPLARRLSGGRSARRRSAPHRLILRQIVPESPPLHFAVRTRPPCAPLSRNTGPAAPGRPAAPVPAFVKLSPVPPRQASGWPPLRCGGSVAPIVHLRWNVLGATPTPALGFVFRFCWGVESVRTKEPRSNRFASRWSGSVQAAYGAAECSGWLRSFLTPPCASPHSAPLRPPHTATPPASASGSDLPRMVLRRSFPFHRSHPLAQLRAAPPSSRSFLTP
jgi:hypothetical protein